MGNGRAHNPKVVGSSPTPATNSEVFTMKRYPFMSNFNTEILLSKVKSLFLSCRKILPVGGISVQDKYGNF